MCIKDAINAGADAHAQLFSCRTVHAELILKCEALRGLLSKLRGLHMPSPQTTGGTRTSTLKQRFVIEASTMLPRMILCGGRRAHTRADCWLHASAAASCRQRCCSVYDVLRARGYAKGR